MSSLPSDVVAIEVEISGSKWSLVDIPTILKYCASLAEVPKGLQQYTITVLPQDDLQVIALHTTNFWCHVGNTFLRKIRESTGSGCHAVASKGMLKVMVPTGVYD